jgi:cyclohexyl-isocyanide hydratase
VLVVARADDIGGGEHLQWPRDVEQLHIREGQDFNGSRLWRDSRVLWHIRQNVTPYVCFVQNTSAEPTMISSDTHLQIGSLLFEGLDQIDLTGPFEVLSRIPNSTYGLYGKTRDGVRDIRGLRLAPDATLADAPKLDVLHVPGGYGQEAVMDDEAILSWVRNQAQGAACVFSVCTGALICGAAGLLKGRRATTHWSAFQLLPILGAIPVNERVVIDGNMVFAAGVTSGIDGALRVAANLRGDEVAQSIQLYMQYAPEPPFNSGTPETAPPAVWKSAQESVRKMTAQREQTALRVAKRLGIASSAATS